MTICGTDGRTDLQHDAPENSTRQDRWKL